MASLKSVLTTALALGWASSVHAQQFPMGRQSYDAMGLSAACTAVLDTELAHCDTLLFERTDRTIDNVVNVLPRAELDLICEPQCREELSALQEKIIATCTSAEDVMRDSGLEFPPVYFADKFSYTFDLNCFKHKTTGRFCDEVWGEWREGVVAFDGCDDCYLGQMAIQLASPIGVSAQRAADFNSSISSCEGISYEFATATAYVKPATTVEAAVAGAEAPPTCERSYTVKEGDSCNSIALSQNASTLDVVQINAIDINCALMPEEGTKLCLDRACETYTIQRGDTCDEIAKQFDISEDQFRALNPMVDSNCTNIERWEGYVACVGPTNLIADSSPARREAEPAPRPATPLKPLAPGSSDKCIEFVNGRAATDPDLVALADGLFTDPETVRGRNKCSGVAQDNGISGFELRRLNPSLVEGKAPRDKCFLEEAYSYCVREEGSPPPVRAEGWDRQWALRWG